MLLLALRGKNVNRLRNVMHTHQSTVQAPPKEMIDALSFLDRVPSTITKPKDGTFGRENKYLSDRSTLIRSQGRLFKLRPMKYKFDERVNPVHVLDDAVYQIYIKIWGMLGL